MIDPTKPIINNVLRMQLQKSINERLDKLIFVEISSSEYDAGIGSHKDNTIYVVTRNESIELYRGERRINLSTENKIYTLIGTTLP